jgi:hypothetical protein
VRGRPIAVSERIVQTCDFLPKCRHKGTLLELLGSLFFRVEATVNRSKKRHVTTVEESNASLDVHPTA